MLEGAVDVDDLGVVELAVLDVRHVIDAIRHGQVVEEGEVLPRRGLPVLDRVAYLHAHAVQKDQRNA